MRQTTQGGTRVTQTLTLAAVLLAGLALVASLGGGASAGTAETAKVGRVTAEVGKIRQVGPGKVAIASARCPKGRRAVSGGFESAEGAGAARTEAPQIRASERDGKRKWVVVAQNPSGTLGLFNAVVYCAK